VTRDLGGGLGSFRAHLTAGPGLQVALVVYCCCVSLKAEIQARGNVVR
jgi:hypothetical protein